MASKIVLIDDLDGTDADETVTFTLDGVTTEIDLSKQNAANLRKSMQEYISHGRRVSGAARAPRSPAPAKAQANASHLASVRKWAGEHGFEVSSRGRVPGKVLSAYEDAHK
jgi:hypothetical protein